MGTSFLVCAGALRPLHTPTVLAISDRRIACSGRVTRSVLPEHDESIASPQMKSISLEVHFFVLPEEENR